MLSGVLVGFLIGCLASGPAWLLYGALVQVKVTDAQRRRRRRAQIDLDGADAVEAWAADIEWQRQQPTNGHPFEGDGVA